MDFRSEAKTHSPKSHIMLPRNIEIDGTDRHVRVLGYGNDWICSQRIQPRIVSIAWMLADNPTRPRVLKYHVIRPDGFSIPARAAEVHGISTERAIAEGKPLKTILADFKHDLLTLNPDAVVAHNASYDMPVIAQEYSSINVENPCSKYETVCTMIQSRSRWPGQSAKLADVYFRIHGKTMDNSHNAMADVLACSQIFFHLQSTD